MDLQAEELTSTCPVCEQAVRQKNFLVYGECALLQCTGCGAVYVNPFPEPENVEGMYSASFERAQSEVMSKMDRKMRRSRSRAKRLRRFSDGNRFLDVGSNVGFMVEAAREAGFRAAGIEIDENYVNVSRRYFPQNEFFCEHLEDHVPDHEGYDMVYCSEVIEHVPDPQGFASALSRLVLPGGKLFITTPDISHWRVPADITEWDAFCPPSHLIYFNPGNLRLLLENHGLVMVKKFMAFKPGIKLLFSKPA